MDNLKVGDWITFECKPSRWARLWCWLTRKTPPDRRAFVVTDTVCIGATVPLAPIRQLTIMVSGD